LIGDVAWETTTKVVVTLNTLGLLEGDRVAVFTSLRPVIEEGIKRFEERRRREQSRLGRSEEPLPECPTVPVPECPRVPVPECPRKPDSPRPFLPPEVPNGPTRDVVGEGCCGSFASVEEPGL
ncbi:MAG: hypothetical protein ABGY75_15060, partial [Gemmataceae bacterium]